MNEALVIIDMERGFMPASEGERLGLHGFGELPVPGGELIIPAINGLTIVIAALGGNRVRHTKDAHPDVTAHFSSRPNYVNTWPKHCVFGTQGAELHPDLYIAKHAISIAYLKGEESCLTPEEDDSYTGALARNPFTDKTLPEELRAEGFNNIVLAGVALGDGDVHKLCVDSTAVDLHSLGFNVTVVTDATEAVLPENKARCFHNLGALGINLATTAEVLQNVRR